MTNQPHLTPQRKIVYEFVFRADSHPTATEIIEGLREQGHKLAYGTVYNSLRYLTEVGLLRELIVGDTVSRYDARTEAHHHIVCRICGRVDESFTPVPYEYLQSVTQETGYQLEDVDLVIKAVCPTCAAKQ